MSAASECCFSGGIVVVSELYDRAFCWTQDVQGGAGGGEDVEKSSGVSCLQLFILVLPFIPLLHPVLLHSSAL